MNSSYSLTPLSTLKKFNFVVEKLAEDKKNKNIDEAIISWCIELSLEKYFPLVSREIINNKNLWLQQNIVLKIALQLYRDLLIETDKRVTKIGLGTYLGNFENISRIDFYHNVQKVKHKMNIKTIVFVAFILTGVGLLLYILNQKNGSSNIRYSIQKNTYSSNVKNVREKYILTLLIKSDRYQDLIYSLKENSYLKPDDSLKLYGATQGLWIGAKNQFNETQIKQELINSNPVTATSEYDVNFVTIELDEDDSRFYPDVNQMDRRDAFIELANKSPRITVSPRLSCKAYENTEFYSR